METETDRFPERTFHFPNHQALAKHFHPQCPGRDRPTGANQLHNSQHTLVIPFRAPK